MLKKVVLGLVVAAVTVAGMVALRQRSVGVHPAVSGADDPARLDDLLLDLPNLDPTTWVRRHLPQATSPGFNLVLYRRRVPMIIDMNGRIVHGWPRVRAVGRVRLNRDGRLAVIGTDNLVKEYDWEGNLTWQHRLPGKDDFPHHDLIQLGNENYLVVARDARTHADYLQEVRRDGVVVWEWRSIDYRGVFPDWKPKHRDPTHINSVYELPPNRWYDSGDGRFRPGNILVSARTLDTIFIIDRAGGEVVWQFNGDLDYQHEASMIGMGEPGEGLILVFNNGFHNRNHYRRSIVQAIDPTISEVEWDYGSKHFFSSVGGTAHHLPGGNMLICSSQGGRAFELSADGDIVWEWTPPFLPMRVERLPYDHCPQLAELTVPNPVAVRPTDDLPFVDIDLYKLGLINNTELRDVGGRKRRVMSWNTGCRELVIPPDATLKVDFGIDEARLRNKFVTARFRLTMASEGSPETLLDVTMDSASEKLWRRHTFSLDELAYQSVEMCIATDAEGESAASLELVVWGAPVISSSTQRPILKARKERITVRERRLREQQLKALGYVN
jgi:hypothetical protein